MREKQDWIKPRNGSRENREWICPVKHGLDLPWEQTEGTTGTGGKTGSGFYSGMDWEETAMGGEELGLEGKPGLDLPSKTWPGSVSGMTGGKLGLDLPWDRLKVKPGSIRTGSIWEWTEGETGTGGKTRPGSASVTGGE